MPELHIIGGCNGSEKTTTAKQILSYFLDIYEYVNADEIASVLRFHDFTVSLLIALKLTNLPKNEGMRLPF